MGTLTQQPDDLDRLQDFQQLSAALKTKILEYHALALMEVLTEPQADRLDAILTEATEDPLLSFWLDEIDHVVAHHLGLIDPDELQRQQQKLLQTVRAFQEEVAADDSLLDGTHCPRDEDPSTPWTGIPNLGHLVMQLREDVQSGVFSQETIHKLQFYLGLLGLYDGNGDGIFGDKTKAALKEFERRQGPDGKMPIPGFS